jgi:23S rRNA (guanine2445-N2)-methyltransferase / 23S rRNA (guanine2069-N7)-methyltransferase
VQALLTLERRDVLTLTPPPSVPPGLLVMNLPYGKRVGERSELHSLHSGLGDQLRKHFGGWRAAFLVEEEQFEAQAKLKAVSVWPLDNGGIQCRLVVVEL